MTKSPPTNSSYWVVPQKLLAGAYPGAAEADAHRQKIEQLLDGGVQVFLSLMEADETNHEGKRFTPYEAEVLTQNPEAKCVRFPIVDCDVPTQSEMSEILDAIDSYHENGKAVYVHCWGGVGRTGTVVACWLLRKGLATTENVFEVLQQLRQHDRERGFRRSPETDIQWQFVREWKKFAS